METIINIYYNNNAKKLNNMVDSILKRLGFANLVDSEDFYCLANEVFVDVLKRYDGKQDFNGFLYSCLVKKIKTEMTRRNRKKRQADRDAISIYTTIGDDENSTLADFIPSKTTLEEDYFDEKEESYSNKMKNYLARLSILQREILRLISIGFEPAEIMAELHINNKQYNDSYKAIHSYNNTKYLI